MDKERATEPFQGDFDPETPVFLRPRSEPIDMTADATEHGQPAFELPELTDEQRTRIAIRRQEKLQRIVNNIRWLELYG